MRVGLLSSGVSTESMTNKAAPVATKVLVRRPAMRCRHWRSSPIRDPKIKATVRRKVKSIQVIGHAPVAAEE
jgi:hypothetical protein